MDGRYLLSGGKGSEQTFADIHPTVHEDAHSLATNSGVNDTCCVQLRWAKLNMADAGLM